MYLVTFCNKNASISFHWHCFSLLFPSSLLICTSLINCYYPSCHVWTYLVHSVKIHVSSVIVLEVNHDELVWLDNSYFPDMSGPTRVKFDLLFCLLSSSKHPFTEAKKNTLKSEINEIIFSSPSGKMDTDFFRSCLIFVGSSPTWGDLFFMKSDIKWAFSYMRLKIGRIIGTWVDMGQNWIGERTHWKIEHNLWTFPNYLIFNKKNIMYLINDYLYIDICIMQTLITRLMKEFWV